MTEQCVILFQNERIQLARSLKNALLGQLDVDVVIYEDLHYSGDANDVERRIFGNTADKFFVFLWSGPVEGLFKVELTIAHRIVTSGRPMRDYHIVLNDGARVAKNVHPWAATRISCPRQSNEDTSPPTLYCRRLAAAVCRWIEGELQDAARRKVVLPTIVCAMTRDEAKEGVEDGTLRPFFGSDESRETLVNSYGSTSRDEWTPPLLATDERFMCWPTVQSVKNTKSIKDLVLCAAAEAEDTAVEIEFFSDQAFSDDNEDRSNYGVWRGTRGSELIVIDVMSLCCDSLMNKLVQYLPPSGSRELTPRMVVVLPEDPFDKSNTRAPAIIDNLNRVMLIKTAYSGTRETSGPTPLVEVIAAGLPAVNRWLRMSVPQVVAAFQRPSAELAERLSLGGSKEPPRVKR